MTDNRSTLSPRAKRALMNTKKVKQPRITARYVALRLASKPQASPYPAWYQAELSEIVAELDTFEPDLKAAFAAVNGTASAFVLPSTAAINAAVDAERWLIAHGVPKAYRKGCEVRVSSGGPTANAYGYAAIGTAFVLRRNAAGDWLLEHVCRTTVYPKRPERTVYGLTPAAKAAVVKHAMRDCVELEDGRPVPAQAA